MLIITCLPFDDCNCWFVNVNECIHVYFVIKKLKQFNVNILTKDQVSYTTIPTSLLSPTQHPAQPPWWNVTISHEHGVSGKLTDRCASFINFTKLPKLSTRNQYKSMIPRRHHRSVIQ